MDTATRGPTIRLPPQNTRKKATFWPSCTLNTHFYEKSAPKKNTAKHKVFRPRRIQGSPTPFSAILLLQRSSRKKRSPSPVRHEARGRGRAAGQDWAGAAQGLGLDGG